MSRDKPSAELICTHGDPADARRAGRDNGIMEGPFSIAVVFLLAEAHGLISGLHRTEKLEEFFLWGLHTTPRSVDDLSDGAEQRLEEGDLFL